MKYHIFYNGPFSQWANSPFTIDGIEFNCAEQWMMLNKALLFGDHETADKIMSTNNPHEQKKLGRQVKNFNDRQWMQVAYKLVVEGNRAKFQQNPEFARYLEATGNDVIVEASPWDRRWGIGLAEDDPRALDESQWQGENLLGKAIMDVRFEMFGC